MRLRALAFALLLLVLSRPAHAQLDRRLILPYSGPFPGHAILVFNVADHARLTAALRGTPYHVAFRRARPARYLSDGAVPGLVPVVLGPEDADRLWEDLDAGRPAGTANGRLRDVLHMTVRLAWTKGASKP